MKRLSFATRSLLPPSVRRPTFAPTALGIGIVHVGLGAFHRAHQAVYTDDAIEKGGGEWGISAISLRSSKAKAQLSPQDGLFVVEQRESAGASYRLVGSVREALFAPDDRAQVLERFARRQTRIVTLTITEKGYTTPETMNLLRDALTLRMEKNGGPLTLVPCDNLAANGRVLKAGLLSGVPAASRFADWVEKNVAFPSTMVDRIVPAVQAADLSAAEAALGVRDEGFVVTEPFRQWVIEDRFAAERPAWELAGVEFVKDVAPYERMKLRLLNATHSALAYLGQVTGKAHLHEIVAVPEVRRFAELLMAEASATVDAPGVDLATYRRSLFDRFANPRVAHRTAQIAQDGSLKVPMRLLATARDASAKGAPFGAVAVAVAAWLLFLRRMPQAVVDPQRDALETLAKTHVEPRAFAQAVLAGEPAPLKDAVAAALVRLEIAPDLRGICDFTKIHA